MRTFAILGDSYSTYKGYIPEDYKHWYADEGNDCENDLRGVENTWWKLFSKETNLELLTNCSYSGSTICNRGYNGEDYTYCSFITRMKRELASNNVKPDLIIVVGGTNDFWAGSPVGEIKYENQTVDELYAFAPSFAYMMKNLKEMQPQARIINVINDDINDELHEIMHEVCKHYNIENLDLKNISKENGHPNTLGMKQISEQIVGFIK